MTVTDCSALAAPVTLRYGSARAFALTLSLAIAVPGAVAAADGREEAGSPATAYSPPANPRWPERVYFGDTHLHTSYSTDAGMIGARLGPDEAYRFARGEQLLSNTGLAVRLRRPLDFLVVADHAENLGLAPAIATSDPALLKSEWGRMVHDFVKEGTVEGQGKAYDAWLDRMNARDDPLAELPELTRTMWGNITAAAEAYNDPGLFTAFIGYEWTSMPGGNNLHRNVVFRDGKARADQVIPMSQYDSTDPEVLWQWMADYEALTGGRVLAIPHNGNLSNGLMFDDVTLVSREPLSAEYAKARMRWEPLYEVTQMKGDGEAHPLLSPDDEFADFETWDKASFGPNPKTPQMLPKEYARAAYQRGLQYERELGVNPFKFGMIGSTDSHTALSTSEENNFFGKVAGLEPSADAVRFDEVIAGRPAPQGFQIYARHTGASGLAAVWATDNTREGLWDAMSRKEVYATTGTRLVVRVFAGFEFSREDLESSEFPAIGYARGVPMGGDLEIPEKGGKPRLLVRAMRDPDGANLDRVQVVKGWLDGDGKLREKVVDVAWSGDRVPGAGGRLPAVGNTVDVKSASYTNEIGSAYLSAFWEDSEFRADQPAFYYVRVLEIPTPRWTTYDAKFFDKPLPRDVPASIQERAYTTPIWYHPAE